MPGTSAVLSTVVTGDYIAEHKIPYVISEDLQAFGRVLAAAVPILWDSHDRARAEVRAKKDL
jgi:hypothetical protein